MFLSLCYSGKKIQTTGHCSIIDAQTAMDLYKLVREEWEEQFIDINNDGGDDNGDGLEEKVTETEQNSTNKPKSGDFLVEEDNSVDKNEPGKTIDGDVKSSDVPEGNGFKVKFGQKRKLPASFDVTNEIIHVSCQNSINDSNSAFNDEMTSVACISSNCSGLNKDENIHCSFECSKHSSSQDIGVDKCSGKVKTKQSKKRKNVSKQTSLATSYSKNVKHLFHDTFWEDQDKFHHYGNVNLN